MAGYDVRGVLQYVPLFRGRLFMVMFDGEALPEPAVAEMLLDLKALQDIGVRLVAGLVGGGVEEFADRASEVELKFAPAGGGARGGEGGAAACRPVLDRGQAVLVDCRGVDPLGPEVGEAGRRLEAAKLIVLVNGPGVIRGGRPLHAVPSSSVAAIGGEVEGVEMLRAAAGVCEGGIARVHILDGRRQGVLAEELFSNEGVGTMVHADSYREIRSLREEDIPELLAMIGRSMRRAHLVPRDYEEIVEKGEDFLVMALDDNVVGCVALHAYGEVGEVACLYVKQSHGGLGYGRALVEAAELRARERGLEGGFALTNRAAGFFRDRLGYVLAGPERIPEARRRKLADSCRHSEVLVKRFGG